MLTLALIALITWLPFAVVFFAQRNEQAARRAAHREKYATAYAWKKAYTEARRVRRLP
jgi:hypothetical protein